MQRVAIYARYSSDLQRDQSIEDQIRLSTERAAKESWDVVNCYSDRGVSGASLLRPGMQALMQDALLQKFDVILTEALDRLSRDQEDIAGFYKRMEFAGVKITTLSEGEINTMHIGLKGTMNALFLKDLADKTRRGLRGKVESGKSGGGIGYGYRVVKQFDANGEAIKGDREINEEQATIVRRIFEEYTVEGKSPKTITMQLNKEGVASPSGKHWGPGSIHGSRKRGLGILNNELYIGQLVWNRQRFIKNPMTGKRVTRSNPESEWIRQEVPKLRIVSQAVWDAAKERQKQMENSISMLFKSNRPQYLFSGLLKCGECGNGFSKLNAERYGCSAARNKGASVCTNRQSIKRVEVEERVLRALQDHLISDDLVKMFCERYTKYTNELRNQQDQTLETYRTELKSVVAERENMIAAIKKGVSAEIVKDDLERSVQRQKELEDFLSQYSHTPKPFIFPTIAKRYQEQIIDLRKALNNEESKPEATKIVRTLIAKIVLTPKPGSKDWSIVLYGDLAETLQVASNQNEHSGKNGHLNNFLDVLPEGESNIEKSIALVAGAGNPLVLLFSALNRSVLRKAS